MESKIKEGQKLREGDYFQGGSEEQFTEIIEIEGKRSTVYASMLAFSGKALYYVDKKIGLIPNYVNDDYALEDEYSFPDFKQLCINTFKDGE